MRAAAIGVHADGGGVDEDLGSCGHRVVSLPGKEAGLHFGSGLKQLHQLQAPLGLAVDDGDAGSTGQGGLDGDGPGGPARTQNHHPFARRVGHLPQRLQEPLAVGVLAHQSLAVHHHAVDGLHQARGLGQAVQMGDHADLAGHGAVAAAKAQHPHRPHGFGQPLVAQFEVDVAPVHAVMAKGLFQHVLGGILGQPVPEAKHQLLSEVPLLGHGFPRLRKSWD